MSEQNKEANWYARRGERVIGPITFSKLQDLVSAGKLRPDDQVRQSSDEGWKAASEVLTFAHQASSSVVDTPPIPSAKSQSAISSPERKESKTIIGVSTKKPSDSHRLASSPPTIPTQPPPTVREQARSGVATLRESAMRIAKLTAIQAEATKIQQVLLPNAYAKLGKLEYDQTADASDGGKYPKMSSLLTQLRVLNEASAEQSSDGSFTDKAKALSGKAVVAAKIKSVKLQLRKEMIIVGKRVFLAGDYSTNAESVTVERLQIRAAELKSEMSEIRRHMPQQRENKGNLVGSAAASGVYSVAVVVSSAVLCAPIGLFLVWRHPTWCKKTKAFWTGTSMACFVFFFTIGQRAQTFVNFNISNRGADSFLTDNPAELIEPILAVKPEDDFDKVFITDNSDYLSVNVREIWHIPSNKKIELPGDTREQVWIRTALSPDGRFMAAVVARFNQSEVPTGTQLQIYTLDEDSMPQLFKNIELEMPSSLPKDFDQPIARIFLNWTQIQWSKDCNTICLASRFAANIVRNWKETVNVQCIAHPEIENYTDRSEDFTGFIEDKSDILGINSISCSPDGSRVAVCYEHGGIQIHSQVTNETHFLDFPPCHTKWMFDFVSFTPDGKIAATVLQQKSDWAEKQGVNVFYVSNEYVFIWDLSTMNVIAKVVPKDDLAPHKHSDIDFLGLMNDGETMLTRSTDPPTVLQVVDIETSSVVRQFAPISKIGGETGFNVVLSADADEVVAYQSDVLQVLSTESGLISRAITKPELVEDVQEIYVSNSGTLAISYWSGEVKLFNRMKSVPLVASSLGTKIRLHDEEVKGKSGPGGEIVYMSETGAEEFYEYFFDKHNEKVLHGICKNEVFYGDGRGRCKSDSEYDSGTLIRKTTRNADGELVEMLEKQDDGTYLRDDVEVLSSDVTVRHRSIAKYTSSGGKTNVQTIKKLGTVLFIHDREVDRSPQYIEGFLNGLNVALTHKRTAEQAKARGDGSYLNVMSLFQRDAPKTISTYQNRANQQMANGSNADQMNGTVDGLTFGYASFGIDPN